MSIFFDPTQPTVQSGQVFLRSPQNPREFLYIEIQGDITSTLPNSGGGGDSDLKRHLWGQRLGDYEEKEGGECTLQVGNLLLVGVKEKLKKPLLVLQRASLSHEEQLAQKKAQQQILYEVHDVEGVQGNANNVIAVTNNRNAGGDAAAAADAQSLGVESLDNYDETIPSTFDAAGNITDSYYLDKTIQSQDDDCVNQNNNTTTTLEPGLLSQQHDEKKINSTPLPPKRHMICRGVILYKIKFDKRPIPLVRALTTTNNSTNAQWWKYAIIIIRHDGNNNKNDDNDVNGNARDGWWYYQFRQSCDVNMIFLLLSIHVSESVGDYGAHALAANLPLPPTHLVC